MAPGKAAKKAAKQTAKKVAKRPAKKLPEHHGRHHHDGKELRRMYEHLGRLSALEEILASGVFARIERLTELAQRSVYAGEPKCAADILRACEHLSFGSLSRPVRAASLTDELEAAIEAEYEHLVEKAEAHWSKNEGRRPAEIEAVYEEMAGEAEAAFAKGAFRRALEFARGAEALAHVRGDIPAVEESEPVENSVEHDRGKPPKPAGSSASRKTVGVKLATKKAGGTKQASPSKAAGNVKRSRR